MPFLMPDLPEAEIDPKIKDPQDEQRRTELAIQRARRQSLAATRNSLVIDPATRAGYDNGLAVRR